MKFHKVQEDAGYFSSQKQQYDSSTNRKYFVTANTNYMSKLQRQKSQQQLPFNNALINKCIPAKKTKKKKKASNPVKKKAKKNVYSIQSFDKFEPIQKSYPNTHYASVYKDSKKLDINIISPGKYEIDESILEQPNWRMEHRRKRNAAIKIQKVFRGYLVRKDLSRLQHILLNQRYEREKEAYLRQKQYQQQQKQWLNQNENSEIPYYSVNINQQLIQFQNLNTDKRQNKIFEQQLPIQFESQQPSTKKQASTHEKSANNPDKGYQQLVQQVVQLKNFKKQKTHQLKQQSSLISIKQIRKYQRQRWDDVITMINQKMIEQNDKHTNLQHWFEQLLVVSRKNKEDLNDTMFFQNSNDRIENLPFFGKNKRQLGLKRLAQEQYDQQLNLLEQISEIDCSYHKDYPLLLKTYKRNQMKRLRQPDLLIQLLQLDPLLASVKNIHRQLEEKKLNKQILQIQKLRRIRQIDNQQQELRINKIQRIAKQSQKNRDHLVKSVLEGNKSLYILEQEIFQNLNKCGIKVKGCSSQGNLKVKKISRALSSIIIDQLHGYHDEIQNNSQKKQMTERKIEILFEDEKPLVDEQKILQQKSERQQKQDIQQNQQKLEKKQQKRQINQDHQQEKPQFQQFFKQPTFFNFSSKDFFNEQNNCLIVSNQPCEPIDIPINIGWKKKNQSVNCAFSKRFNKISLIPAPKETIMLQSDSEQQQLVAKESNKQQITQKILFQILKEVALELFFKVNIISKFNLSKYNFPLVSNETKVNYLDHVEKLLPSYDIMLDRMNQKFVPSPLDRLKIFRTCIDQQEDEDSDDDACFEQIGHYEPIIDPQLCQLAFQSFYKGIQQTQQFYQHVRANEMNTGHLSKQLIYSPIQMSDLNSANQIKLIQQRGKETIQRKKLNKQLKKEFLNIQVHALFQAWNQQLLFLVLPIKTVSGIGLKELQMSLKPHQSLITSRRAAVRLIYESKKQIQEIIEDERDLAEKQLLQNYELMCLDSNWISYSQDALHLFCQLIFLLEETLFAEAAVDLMGKEHFLGYYLQ